MRHDRPPRRFVGASSLSCAASLVLVVSAFASDRGRWTYSIAAAPAPTYTYRVDDFGFGSYRQRFGTGLTGGVSAMRTVTRHVSLVFEGGYHGYSAPIGLVAIPEVPPTTGRLRAEFFSLGAGLRLEPFADRTRSPRLFLEIQPALFVSRWEERTVDHEGYDMISGSWRPRTTHSDAYRSALPGFAATMGVRTRVSSVVGLETAVRLTRSADLGEHTLGRFSSGDFRGLDETAFVAGFSWSP